MKKKLQTSVHFPLPTDARCFHAGCPDRPVVIRTVERLGGGEIYSVLLCSAHAADGKETK